MGSRTRRSRLLLGSGLVMLSLLFGCAEESVPSRILPEPEQALRDPSLGGGVLPEARIADYYLEASLDTEIHRVTGTARVTWRNTTDQTVDTVPFHLYMNGFRSESTAWMRDSRGQFRSSEQDSDGAWGYIDVAEVVLLSLGPGDSESGVGQRMPLPFSEDADPSTMTVQLPRSVEPGDRLEMELKFTTQLPKVVARTGFGDSFHAVAQWYPKIGVLDDDGWQAHTFTQHDEFFADFGNYRVEITVPVEEVVGATGIRVAEVELDNGLKRLTYEAEMVHDFVWMTDPDFVTLDTEHNGIRIRQLIQPEKAATAIFHEDGLVAALDSYEQRFGLYPWSTITIVHPPEGAEGAGGMEYPTLFTSSDTAEIPDWVRRRLLDERFSGVYTTVHEFGHQYFQGLFASREHEEPWMDEGLNTMSNALAYLDRFDDPWVVKIGRQKVYTEDMMRLASASSGASLVPVDSPAHDFGTVPGSYGTTVYQKTGAIMLTLRNLVGVEAFDRVFRIYGERFRFRHPRGDDLEGLFIEQLGETVELSGDVTNGPGTLHLPTFFEQALRTVKKVDYALGRLMIRRMAGEEGYQRDASGRLVGGEEPSWLDQDLEDLEDHEVVSVVRVERLGDFVLPVELEVELADGSVERRVWDGKDAFKNFEWPGQRVRRATLDPDRKILLENRLLNNTEHSREGRDEAPAFGGPIGDLAESLALLILGGFMP